MAEMAGLIAFLLAVAFLLRIDFVFYIVYVCIGVFAWSRWYTPRAFRRLRAERNYTDHAFLGEPITVTIKLYNDNRLAFPWLEFTETVALELQSTHTLSRVASLPGQAAAEFSYEIRSQRRGYYQIGPLRLRTGDLFGLVNEYQGQLAPDYLTVYPAITPLSQLGLPSRLPFGTIRSNQRLFADPARPMGVRDFRSGDPLHQINWKASAHARALLVKTFEPAISLETAVLLNLYYDDYHEDFRYEAVEWAIEVAASAAVHLIDQQQRVGFATNGADPLITTRRDGEGAAEFDEVSGRLHWQRTADGGEHKAPAHVPPPLPPRPGRPHLMKILEHLARVEADITIPFGQWAPSVCLDLSWGVTVPVITPKGSEAVCQTLHRLVRTGLNPILIVVEPDYNFSRVRQRARQLGFTAYHVARRRDLDIWRQRARVNV